MSFPSNQTDFGSDSLQNTNHTLHIMVTSWMSHYLSAFLSDPFVKKWFGWFMTPVFVAFLLPVVFCLLLWSTSLLLYIHRVHKRRLMRRLTEAVNERDIHKAGRNIVSAIFDAQVCAYLDATAFIVIDENWMRY